MVLCAAVGDSVTNSPRNGRWAGMRTQQISARSLFSGWGTEKDSGTDNNDSVSPRPPDGGATADAEPAQAGALGARSRAPRVVAVPMRRAHRPWVPRLLQASEASEWDSGDSMYVTRGLPAQRFHMCSTRTRAPAHSANHSEPARHLALCRRALVARTLKEKCQIRVFALSSRRWVFVAGCPKWRPSRGWHKSKKTRRGMPTSSSTRCGQPNMPGPHPLPVPASPPPPRHAPPRGPIHTTPIVAHCQNIAARWQQRGAW